jgi:transposase-like protein
MDIEATDKLIKSIVKTDDAAQDVWVEILEQNITDESEIRQIASKCKYGKLQRPYSEISGETLINHNNGDSETVLFDMIPSMPLYPMDDGGFIQDTITSIKNNRKKHHYTSRIIDVYCKFCDSAHINRIINYTRTHGERTHYYCLNCRRGFNYNPPFRVSGVVCEHCGSKDIDRYGKYKSSHYYWCKNCQRKFRGSEYLFHSRALKAHVNKAMEYHLKGLGCYKISQVLKSEFGHKYSKCTIWRWVQQGRTP